MSILLLVCCFVISSKTQSQKQLDCDFNFKEALSYIRLSQNFKQDSLKIINLLKPCLKKGDDNAQMLMGRLYAVRGNEKSYKKAFKLFKKAVKKDNSSAMVDLGILYKYGKGCNLNLNKARKWFNKAAKSGNDKAAYSLGYMYLKGFGSIDQDYTKAVKWFKESEYPMAKYWLGVCYYYGYGVQQSLTTANKLLGTNFKSTTISNISTVNTNETSVDITKNLFTDSEEVETTEDLTQDTLLGKWTGLLLKYDWSENHIEQKHPITIEFKNDSINETQTYTITINEEVLTGSLNQVNNTIYFDDTTIKLPHISFHKRIPSELDYNLLSVDITTKEIAESRFLIGNFENYIEKWNESGAPLKFVLKKKETYSNNDIEISDDVLQALAAQEQKFVKLYPNPFQTDLIISYTLDEPSFVEVKIADINGTKNIVVERAKLQKKGKHRYFFDGSVLEKGIYVVTVIVNNQRKTRIIVKK